MTDHSSACPGLVLAEQMTDVPSDLIAQRRRPAKEVFALPSATGGLAGAAVHQLSLGWVVRTVHATRGVNGAHRFVENHRNVYRLAALLRLPSSPNVQRAPSLKSISLIGVGGAHDAESVERFRKVGADAVVRPALLPLARWASRDEQVLTES